jgi:AbrB family looped-hinge helix DNA binding protein
MVKSSRDDKMPRVVTKIAEGGRVVIPAEFRKSLGLKVGDEVVLALEEGAVRVLTQQEAIRRAQALVRAHVPAGRSLSEELIEERRRESQLE